MSTQNDVAQIMAMIGAAYPNFTVTQAVGMVYYDLLKDIPADVLKAATMQCCAEAGRKFAPSVGEIRGAVGEINRQIRGVPSALQAWGELLKAPKEEKIYEETNERNDDGAIIINVYPYKWSHPLVREVAVMMGFPRFPDWESESFERTAFLKAYEIELQRYLKQDIQIQDVSRMIEEKRTQELTAGSQIKQLTEGMEK